MARWFFCFLLILPNLAHADGIERLKEFFRSTTSMRALFHQTVVDSKGRKVQEVDGSMQLQRPGKFHWDYYKPYLQLIVGDGEKVWLYDPELNQVTVRALDKALGSSPAALLSFLNLRLAVAWISAGNRRLPVPCQISSASLSEKLLITQLP